MEDTLCPVIYNGLGDLVSLLGHYIPALRIHHDDDTNAGKLEEARKLITEVRTSICPQHMSLIGQSQEDRCPKDTT